MSPAPGTGWDRVPAADALEIGTVLSRCARVLDARAWQDLDRVFTGDAVLVSPGGTARGPAQIAERTPAGTRDPHLITDTVLRRLAPDRVRAWSKWLVVCADGSALGGDQLDLFVRTPDGWRIAERRIAALGVPGSGTPARTLGTADFLA
ncbi:nuclear transport factor 2 family protein [Kocuria rhizosphaericola]|uniref:nuclear transport factor 2 family protein n=1 Tax=Kocuria rhizosphaericola TaxID=3376284 RepID=UPI0037B05F4E